MGADDAPPRTGSNPEQLADYGFYAGIGGAVLTFTTCIPIINFCTCFLAPTASAAAIVLSLMARSNFGPEAVGQPAERAQWGLWLGIGGLVLYVLTQIGLFMFGFGIGLLDAFQEGAF